MGSPLISHSNSVSSPPAHSFRLLRGTRVRLWSAGVLRDILRWIANCESTTWFVNTPSRLSRVGRRISDFSVSSNVRFVATPESSDDISRLLPTGPMQCVLRRFPTSTRPPPVSWHTKRLFGAPSASWGGTYQYNRCRSRCARRQATASLPKPHRRRTKELSHGSRERFLSPELMLHSSL